jgi:hypothetical protein
MFLPIVRRLTILKGRIVMSPFHDSLGHGGTGRFPLFVFLTCLLVLSPGAGTHEASTATILAGRQSAKCVNGANQERTSNVSSSRTHGAAKTGMDCTTNACRDNGGCATCVRLDLQLPLNAKVLAVHCFTNAHHPEDFPKSELHEIRCTADNAWSIFESPVVTYGSEFSVVTTIFHNRSSDRDRMVRLDVEWQ